jgi:4-hydroxybenzoate polyprenyltransferase
MIVKFDRSGLKQTTWREYLVRFAFGGLITVAAGGIGKEWGPVVAGLFLAFPAIFPASATIVEKHERERKQNQGLHGEQRGIEAAADDALGAAIGSVGLLAFAAIGWWLIPRYSPVFVLISAMLAWIAAAGSSWIFRKHGRRRIFR